MQRMSMQWVGKGVIKRSVDDRVSKIQDDLLSRRGVFSTRCYEIVTGD